MVNATMQAAGRVAFYGTADQLAGNGATKSRQRKLKNTALFFPSFWTKNQENCFETMNIVFRKKITNIRK